MVRADDGLGFLLRYENVAHYKDGVVFILDRRVYPAREEFVRCPDYHAVARAIADMVTQSGGPWLAAALGMVSAARDVRGMTKEPAQTGLARAAETLASARPTTSARMRAHLGRILDVACEAVDRDGDPEQAAYDFVMDQLDRRYQDAHRLGRHAASLLPARGTVLTQCFAETLIGFTLLAAQEQGRQLALVCPETRPYLQGARLTASVAFDQGVPVTVVSDNMPAYLMSQGRIDAFLSAADVITLDGHVVNKIGTFQIAIAAHYHGIPYYVLGSPSPANPTMDTIQIEMRDPDEVLHAMGVRTTKPGVQGLYPAFDVTPPHLVSAVVTPEGIFSPYNLAALFGRKEGSDA